MSVTILEDRLEKFLKKGVHLRSGKGDGVDKDGFIDLCIIQATNWLVGGNGKKDEHPCVDRLVRNWAIGMNDADGFQYFRDELKPYAVKVAGTNKGKELSEKREIMIIEWAIQEFLIPELKAWAKIDKSINGTLISSYWLNKLGNLMFLQAEVSETLKTLKKELREVEKSLSQYNSQDYSYKDNLYDLDFAQRVASTLEYGSSNSQFIFDLIELVTEDIPYWVEKPSKEAKKRWKECLAVLDKLIEAK